MQKIKQLYLQYWVWLPLVALILALIIQHVGAIPPCSTCISIRYHLCIMAMLIPLTAIKKLHYPTLTAILIFSTIPILSLTKDTIISSIDFFNGLNYSCKLFPDIPFYFELAKQFIWLFNAEGRCSDNTSLTLFLTILAAIISIATTLSAVYLRRKGESSGK